MNDALTMGHGGRRPFGVPIVSFEAKVMWICLAATAGALALGFTALLWEDWNSDRVDWTADQIRVGQLIAAKAASGNAAVDLGAARATVESDDSLMAAVWFPAAGPGVVLSSRKPAEALLRPTGDARPTSQFGPGGLVTRVPYVSEGRRVGELVMLAQADDLNNMLVRNILYAVVLSAIVMLMAAALAWSLTRRSLRPLHALDQGIDALRQSHDFTGRVVETSNDEFGRLTRNFNDLLADLQAYEARQSETMQALTAARDAAHEANVMKSQFLANVSHEIRTPLNGVLGMAQVMATGALTRVQRERLEVIETSGGALLSILNDILDLSKIEAGRLEIEETPFDIAEVTRDACAAFASVAGAKQVSFITEVSDEASGRWRGDPTRVRQLISNLVSNALKFTAEGEVRVRVDAETDASGKALTLCVSDTGIGIAPDALQRIFDKFVQADNTTTRRFGGTGLGLTICRRIAELMGGSIEAHSTAGEGSRFNVRLPLVWLGPADAPAAAVAPHEPEAVADLSTLKVLAADDNETNRLVLRTVLETFGLEPRMVDDGRQAVEAWETGDYDVILMDIQMPVLDGVLATAEIRRIEAERGLPRTRIIALTANAMKHQAEEYLAAGLDGHLAKPIIVSSLYAALAETLARPARADEHAA
jgi:signal transduction histidine kinase/ActR/RegA family two-component response regulator